MAAPKRFPDRDEIASVEAEGDGVEAGVRWTSAEGSPAA